jgi:hypothetical protein
VLFFFPSYGAMDTLTARWQVCTCPAEPVLNLPATEHLQMQDIGL